MHLFYLLENFQDDFSNHRLTVLSLCNVFTGHAQDKQIQRDDEYYDGDNDNDHNMDDA